MAILAECSPYTLNISSLCKTLQSSRNNVLKLIDLMDKAALIGHGDKIPLWLFGLLY